MSAIYRKIEFFQPKRYDRDILSNPPSATAFTTAGAIAALQLTGFGLKRTHSSPKSAKSWQSLNLGIHSSGTKRQEMAEFGREIKFSSSPMSMGVQYRHARYPIPERRPTMTTLGSGHYTYTVQENWAKLPEGETFAMVSRHRHRLPGPRLCLPAQGAPRPHLRPRRQPPGLLGQRLLPLRPRLLH